MRPLSYVYCNATHITNEILFWWELMLYVHQTDAFFSPYFVLGIHQLINYKKQFHCMVDADDCSYLFLVLSYSRFLIAVRLPQIGLWFAIYTYVYVWLRIKLTLHISPPTLAHGKIHKQEHEVRCLESFLFSTKRTSINISVWWAKWIWSKWARTSNVERIYKFKMFLANDRSRRICLFSQWLYSCS